MPFLRISRFPEGDGTGGGGAGGDYVPPTIDMATALPPEYRENPAFKGKDFVSLVKEHANLQTLIGQRPAGIPDDKASDEDRGKFLSALRPKDLKEYQFPETEYSKTNKRSSEFETAVREIMAEAGVPKWQFPKAVAKVEAWLMQGQKATLEAKQKATDAQNTEFEALLDKTYGAEKGKVTDRAKVLMLESVAPELKEKVSAVLGNISNDTLFALTAVLNGIHAKYIAEDAPPGGDNPPGGDTSSLQSEAEKIMKSEEYRDWRKPGHEEAKAKVQELFGRIAGAKK